MTDHEQGDAGDVDFDWAAAARFLAGELDWADAARFEAWVDAAPGRRRILDGLRIVWQRSTHPRADWDAEAADRALQERMGAGNRLPEPGATDAYGAPSPIASPRRSRGERPPVVVLAETRARRWSRARGRAGPPTTWGGTTHWVGIAAVVLAAFGVATLVTHRRGARSDGGAREYSTVAGERLSVTLANGTEMTLAPDSRARMADGFEGGAREVTLDGEAYFAVVHDAAHPFLVRTRNAVTRDVGTAFDVRAYANEPGVRITVADGAVAVHATAGCRASAAAAGPGTAHPCGAEARRGDVATVVGGGIAVQHGVDVASVGAWRTGRLVFTDVPLRQVAVELQRWYGVSITFGDTGVADRLWTATLSHEPLDEVLDALSASTAARYERRQDGTIVMYDLTAHHGGTR